jgi:RNA polymerase sigma-70 factor (ECF subfamily)
MFGIVPGESAGKLENNSLMTSGNTPVLFRLIPDDHSSPDVPASEAAIDADLVRKFLAGNESAFNEIVTRYSGKLYGLTFNLLRNSADAEEVTQDTFIRAYRGLVRFRGDSSLATWLHRIAVNLARNRYWYFFRRRRHNWVSLDRPLTEDSAATFADLIASGDNDPAQETATAEFTSLVATCMERLDHRHREILTMRNVFDLSYEEIAQALGINIGTVKSRIARAREYLREILAESCPEFGCAKTDTDFFLSPRTFSGQPAASCV